MNQDSIGQVVAGEEPESGMVAHTPRRTSAAARPSPQVRASARRRANRLDIAIAWMNAHELESVTLTIKTKRGIRSTTQSHPAILNAIRSALKIAMEDQQFLGGIHESQIYRRRLEEEAEAQARRAI